MRWAAAPTGLHNSIFSNHNWSYLWLSVSGAGWNTPAAVWLGLSSLLNNELLVHMSFRADRDSQMRVKILTLLPGKGGKNTCLTCRNRMKPTSLLVSNSRVCVWKSCALVCCASVSDLQAELACPRSSGKAVAAGPHMWLHVRFLQEHTAAAAGRRPAPFSADRVSTDCSVTTSGWGCRAPPPPPTFSCSIADFLPSFYTSGAKHTSQLTKQQLSGCVQL